MYLALGILFLIVSIIMAGIIVFTAVRSVKKGGDVITKKNLFYLAPTFLIIYFMHVTAAAFIGESFNFFYFFSLINTVLDVLKFKAESKLILPICQAYPIYYVDFVLAFVVGGAAVILSIASFFSQRIGNYFWVKILLRNDCDIVLDDSKDAIKYVKNTKNCILLGTNVTRQRYSDLLKDGVRVLRVPFEEKTLLRKIKRGKHNFIVFRDGNNSYTKVIGGLSALVSAGRVERIHLEANLQEMKILKEKFISKADNGTGAYLAGFSKYEITSRRFVVDYPITKYIPRSFYNKNLTLQSDVDINVIFIGFGKVNYQLFRMCAMQFQFAQEADGKLASKPVRYFIYDNTEKAMHNEFFSRILYEFDDEFSDCDFPKPERICLLDRERLDINSVEVKQKFKKLVHSRSFTYFVVSLDNDLEDASYAQTVTRLFSDDANYRIFVRAKNNNGEKLNDLNDKITYFGEEKKLYTHENIVNDDLSELAQRINILYNKISDPPKWLKYLKESKNLSAEAQRKLLCGNLADPSNRKYMLKKWVELNPIEQASNLYHAMNLPFKLHLLGYDMVKKQSDGDRGITEAEFNEKYENSGREEGYKDYSFFFKTEVSNVLAYIEHSRWNALYILYDFKQMKKEDIQIAEELDKDGNTVRTMPHKNVALKQHACITTYYGLHELIEYKFETLYPGCKLEKAIYKNDARLQELSKIYAYDYMDLDRLYSEITAMGYALKPSGAKGAK